MFLSFGPGASKKEKMLHPRKLTWNLEMMVSNRNLLFQGAPIFRFPAVCFGGCNVSMKSLSGGSFISKVDLEDRVVNVALLGLAEQSVDEQQDLQQ